MYQKYNTNYNDLNQLKEEEENESWKKSPLEEVRGKTPNPLTRRELLGQVGSFYDPIGLITPAKQKGTILVRRAFQEAGTRCLTRNTWVEPLSEKLREEAIQLFEEYVCLSQVTFHRSLTPANWIGKPWGVTFSDGGDKCYGAVVYFRWETETCPSPIG